ncbi:ATP-binding protein [Caulobacter segnis]|jgi:signal transduction histidine kinase|uniref:ATP-binding protein n=1 Tax=Caulobacter segnis TaxID=88688 RepID=UPI002860E186|nr:ATP-binding protein [Caulobacter segnis]MDR6623859.1 signal transduction histidine kinase [Caulobacter segnis]
MTRDEAIAALSSDATEVRLRAARFFSFEANAEDGTRLKAALRKETVPWIKRALQSAVTRADQPPGPVAPTDRPAAETLEGLDAQQIYAKAAEEVADSLIHELAPVVGLLRVVLPKELNEAFKASQSRVYLDQLHSLMTAIRALKRANAVPSYKDFQIAELIGAVIAAAPNPDGVLIQTAGPSRLIVSADKDQLTLAIGNGLRNALEAVKPYADSTPARIVITWGATQSDNFVVIKDNGPGFRGDPAAALKLGATSKSGHVGYGLALAHQAMLSMQGDIVLKNDEDGAHFEIRWFRDNEDPVR